MYCKAASELDILVSEMFVIILDLRVINLIFTCSFYYTNTCRNGPLLNKTQDNLVVVLHLEIKSDGRKPQKPQ